MMSVILKRDATGLCRCPDGSLAICGDCDCAFTGQAIIYVEAFGPLYLSYWGDETSDWRGTSSGSGEFPITGYNPVSGTGWEMTISILSSGECAWYYVITIAIKSGDAVVGYATYQTMDGESVGHHCWSGSYVLSLMPALSSDHDWLSAIDASTEGAEEV